MILKEGVEESREMIPILQCGGCKFSKTFKWEVSVEVEGLGKLTCSQYPEGIPSYVEEATDDCQEFKEK